MLLHATFPNIQPYKLRIKGKVEQSMERSCTPLQLDVVALEKMVALN